MAERADRRSHIARDKTKPPSIGVEAVESGDSRPQAFLAFRQDIGLVFRDIPVHKKLDHMISVVG
jgi:hypothetical protein